MKEPWNDEELMQRDWDHSVEGIAARTGSALQCSTESASILEGRRMGIYWPVGRQMHSGPRGPIGWDAVDLIADVVDGHNALSIA